MAITEKKLDKWARNQDLKKLHTALSTHDYKIRLSAVRYLGQIGHRDSLPHLEALVNDPFISVLKSTAVAIKAIRAEHPAIEIFLNKIDEKEAFDRRQQARTEANFEPVPEEEEREALIRMAQEYSIRQIRKKGLAQERRQLVNWKLAGVFGFLVIGIIWLLYYLYII